MTMTDLFHDTGVGSVSFTFVYPHLPSLERVQPPSAWGSLPWVGPEPCSLFSLRRLGGDQLSLGTSLLLCSLLQPTLRLGPAAHPDALPTTLWISSPTSVLDIHPCLLPIWFRFLGVSSTLRCLLPSRLHPTLSETGSRSSRSRCKAAFI